MINLSAMENRLNRLFLLQEGEFRKLLPFFLLHFALYLMNATGSCIAISLFVKKIGAETLPYYYIINAFINLGLSSIYMLFADRVSNKTLFKIILMIITLPWILGWSVITLLHPQNVTIYSIFFITSEFCNTIIISHFGAFFRDYFNRDEITRILPIVYTGGRLGYVVSGLLLSFLTSFISVLNLVFVYIAQGLLAFIVISKFKKVTLQNLILKETVQNSGPNAEIENSEESTSVRNRFSDFIRFAAQSSLIQWISITAFLFFICKYFINFQYNNYFEDFFPSEQEMVRFMGIYTAIAFSVAILLQSLFVNRLIQKIGLRFASLLYNIFVMIAGILCLLPMSLSSAIFCKFIETELRVSYRNPITQMFWNYYPHQFKTRAISFNTSIVVPCAVIFSSLIMIYALTSGKIALLSVFMFVCTLIFFIASLFIFKVKFEDKKNI